MSPLANDLLQTAIQHHNAGHLPQAELIYRQILESNPEHQDALYLLGLIATQQKKLKDAEKLIQKAIRIKPSAYMFYDLGKIYRQQSKTNEAIKCFKQSIKLKSDFADVLIDLGNLLQIIKHYQEASDYYQRAIDLCPNYAEAHYNYGRTLGALGRYEQAIEHYRSALRLNPQYFEAYNNLGNTYGLQGLLSEAQDCFYKALALQPNNPDPHLNLGICLLTLGDYQRGFEEYDWRWDNEQFKSTHRQFSQPRWRGEDIAGKTLLVFSEQGLGDTIQFCRYAPLLVDRGIKIILSVPPPLVRLLKTLPHVDNVVSNDGPLPAFDWQCPTLSLPRAFQTTLATIPNKVPYLSASKIDLVLWKTLIPPKADQLKIGLAWAGNPSKPKDQARSLHPDFFAPLLKNTPHAFYSLQKDGPKAPSSLGLVDWMNKCQDLADTASLIMQLDLVITVDTAIAHLAGALGKPVWLLNRFDSCWRWMLNRDDSPWYPTMRLFRQKTAGDWSTVLQQLIQALPHFGKAS